MCLLAVVAEGLSMMPVRVRGTGRRVLLASSAAGEVSRPKGLVPKLTLPGDTLEVRPHHVATVLGTTSVALVGCVCSARRLAPVSAVGAMACGVVLADLLSGAFHWATDNYGSIETPLFGQACVAFQGHHLAPWTITFRPTFNNVHKIARAVCPLAAAAAVFLPPFAALAAVVMLYGQVAAQEFHKWSHMPPSEQPRLARAMQRAGLAVSTREHGRHHLPPYGAHYCIFNGALNPLLDGTRLFRRLEAAIYRRNGVEPNCWKDGDKGAKLRILALAL